MNPTPQELGAEALALCRRLGFALAGICDARPSGRDAELRRWLAEGRHGSMEWLARTVDARLAPEIFFPGARSLIVVADQYAAPGDGQESNAAEARSDERRAHNRDAGAYLEKDGSGARNRGKIARYARGDDYHEVVKRRLHALCDALRARWADMQPAHTLRAFVDTAPVLEREHAARARLGWIGKHTLLINPTLGSYLLLGGVVTSAHIVASAPDPDSAEPPGPMPDHCGSCTRCIDACPTGAITPYRVDARRCVSYLTIEHRAPIDPALHAGVGAWLFGCDICQDVCPHNRPRERSEAITPNEAYAPKRDGFDLLEVLGWSADDRSRALTRSTMKRATLDMMRRNALIVAGNLLSRSGEPGKALRARIAEIAHDENEPAMVRETARTIESATRAGD